MPRALLMVLGLLLCSTAAVAQENADVAPDELTDDPPPAPLDSDAAGSNDEGADSGDAPPDPAASSERAPADPAAHDEVGLEEDTDDTYGTPDEGDESPYGRDDDRGDDDYRDRGAADGPADRSPPDDADRPAEEEGKDPLVAGGAAYGAGAAVMSTFFFTQLATSSLSLATAFLPAAASVLQPISFGVDLLACGMCCGLPAAEGAAITAAGDFMLGSEPGAAYLWTILASYGACYGGGLVLVVVQLAALAAIGGATLLLPGNPASFGTVTPLQLGLGAASTVGLTLLFAGVQPIVPAAVWYLTAEQPGGATSTGNDAYDERRPSPRDRRNRRRRSVEMEPNTPTMTRVAMAF